MKEEPPSAAQRSSVHSALSCRHQDVYTKLVVTCVHPDIAMSVCVGITTYIDHTQTIIGMPQHFSILNVSFEVDQPRKPPAPHCQGPDHHGDAPTLFKVQGQFQGRPTPKPPAPICRGQFCGPSTSKPTPKPPSDVGGFGVSFEVELTSKPLASEVSGSASRSN